MSFHVIQQSPARLSRGEPAVPGRVAQMVEKASPSEARAICLDLEDAKGLKKRIGFGHIIGTALRMQNVAAIAGASRRIESLHFGVADCAAEGKGAVSLDDRLIDNASIHQAGVRVEKAGQIAGS